MAVGGSRAAETEVACVETAGVTVVIAGIPSAAAATDGFNVGPNLDLPKDMVEGGVLVRVS